MYKLTLILVVSLISASPVYAEPTYFCSADNEVVIEADWSKRDAEKWKVFDEFLSAANTNDVDKIRSITTRVDGSTTYLNNLLDGDPKFYTAYKRLFDVQGIRANQITWGKYQVGLVDVKSFFGEIVQPQAIICEGDSAKCEYSYFNSVADEAWPKNFAYMLELIVDAKKSCKVDPSTLRLGAEFISPLLGQTGNSIKLHLHKSKIGEKSAAKELESWLAKCRDDEQCELKKFIFTTFFLDNKSANSKREKAVFNKLKILDNPMLDSDFSLQATKVTKYSIAAGDYYIFWLNSPGIGLYYYVVPVDKGGKFSSDMMRTAFYSLIKTEEFARELFPE